MLKHVRRLFPAPSGLPPLAVEVATSTSFIKVVDVPYIRAAPREWQLAQRAAFSSALKSSPVGSALADIIKHTPRFMRVSPHSDRVIAWLDICCTAWLYCHRYRLDGAVRW